jgi:hypothetical protein
MTFTHEMLLLAKILKKYLHLHNKHHMFVP